MLRTVSLWVLAAFYIAGGMNHFLNPGPYLRMMPGYLPWHHELVAVSGMAEVLGGLGILVPKLRVAAGWALIALLVAVFPANLHVALHGWEGVALPQWVLWARLPFQALFVAWVYWTCVAPGRCSPK